MASIPSPSNIYAPARPPTPRWEKRMSRRVRRLVRGAPRTQSSDPTRFRVYAASMPSAKSPILTPATRGWGGVELEPTGAEHKRPTSRWREWQARIGRVPYLLTLVASGMVALCILMALALLALQRSSMRMQSLLHLAMMGRQEPLWRSQMFSSNERLRMHRGSALHSSVL